MSGLDAADGRSPGLSEIPTFFLYGEPPRDVSDRFLHVENLEERCRPSQWSIRRHAHERLHHAILVHQGAGRVEHDGSVEAFEGSHLLLTPARTIHGFEFSPDTQGWVATVSETYLSDLGRRDVLLAEVFARPAIIYVGGRVCEGLVNGLVRLERELGWEAPGHRLMVEALLTGVMIDVARQLPRPKRSVEPGGDAELVARFRDLLEQTYRKRPSVVEQARALGVSESRLRQACRAVAGGSPVQLTNERVISEARRLLLYSSMTVGQTAEALGFDDPAYFSRLFQQLVGMSARDYRKAQRSTPTD